MSRLWAACTLVSMGWAMVELMMGANISAIASLLGAGTFLLLEYKST